MIMVDMMTGAMTFTMNVMNMGVLLQMTIDVVHHHPREEVMDQGEMLLRFVVKSKRIRPYGIVEIMLQAVMNRIERIAMVFGVVKMVNIIHNSSRGMADKALRIVAIRDTATIGTIEKGTVLHPINGVVVVVTNQSRLVYHMVVPAETLLPIHATLRMPGIM